MGRIASAARDRPPGVRRAFLLIIILIFYFISGVLYATHTPAWQAPDEPAHYNYVGQVAGGSLPVIEPSDYDEQYRGAAVSSGFADDYPIEPLTYEDWQPPLYYLLLAPVFVLTGGAHLPLRLVSLVIGAGIIIAAHVFAAALWPNRPWLAFTATAFVALLPQHVAILSSVNNDSLALLIVAHILCSLAIILTKSRAKNRPVDRRWLAIGVLLGLGFITKLTVYIMAPVILLAMIIACWRQGRSWLRSFSFVAIPAALIAGPWWLRNLLVYPGFDPLAMRAHDAVVVGQPRTVEWLETYGALETAQRFVTTTFRSFWGQFGWMGVLMEPRIYQLLLLFSLAVGAGLIWRLLASRRRSVASDNGRRRLVGVLGATLLLNIILYLGYNVTFVQHQGRYLFPALIPIAAGVALGIEAWTAPFIRRLPLLKIVVPLLLAAALLALNLMAVFRYIVPQLATP